MAAAAQKNIYSEEDLQKTMAQKLSRAECRSLLQELGPQDRLEAKHFTYPLKAKKLIAHIDSPDYGTFQEWARWHRTELKVAVDKSWARWEVMLRLVHHYLRQM